MCFCSLSCRFSFILLCFAGESPTPCPIRLSPFIRHVWVRAKLITDISPLTPLTFLLMPLRCVLFVPQTNYPLPSLLSPPKKPFPVYCVHVCEREGLGPWMKNPVDKWKIAIPPFFSPISSLFISFLFLKPPPKLYVHFQPLALFFIFIFYF